MKISLKFVLLLQWQCLAENEDGQDSEPKEEFPESRRKYLANYGDITGADYDMHEAVALEGKPMPTTKSLPQNKLPEIVKHVNHSIFPSLDNYHYAASVITESKYPFIAKVVHSKTLDYPFVCTAVCIENQIFITAARCIPLLKIEYTTVIHKKTRLHPIAFLLPSSPTKQMFDDIGIIVVNGTGFKRHWGVVKLFQGNRTDNTYQWLAQLQLYKTMQHVAIGYAADKSSAKMKTPETKFELLELQVHVGITLCTVYGRKIGYYVPCYHACDLTKPSDPKCNKYLGTEGAAVLNVKTHRLLGIATWGGKKIHELPVGFSVPNSDNFFEDLTCARKIRDSDAVNPPKDFYKTLCGKK